MRAGLGGGRAGAVALLLLLGFTLTAILGYWNFALHPERLAGVPGALEFYASSFQFFARAHIVLAAATLAVVLIRHTGARWLVAFAAVYVLSFTSEHVGTGYGIPFGGYGYTGLLGFKLGGRVPALIPLSWFLMALPSWVVARTLVGDRGTVVHRMAVGAGLLTAWDLALDPAMSYLTTYWLWAESGPYYGMPWMNLLGWFVTGLALMAALEGARRFVNLDALPVRWMAAYYLVTLLMPLGMVVAAGLWLAVAVTAGGLAAVLVGGLVVRAWAASAPAPFPARSPASTGAVAGAR